MPTFELSGPDGGTYHVDAPDEHGALAAFHSMSEQPSTLEDAGKSLASGLASATAGTLGAAGDARSLLSSATDLAGSKLGISPDKVQAFKDLASKAAGMTGVGSVLANAPTSRDIVSAAAPYSIVSPDYEPKTGLGGVLKTGAEFLPAIADPELAGPNALKSGARLFATRVAAPALASEGAGELTKGTAAEPYARAGAAIAAGSVADGFNALMAARASKPAIPSAEDLLSTAGRQFENVKSSDAIIKPAAVEQMAKDVRTELLNDGAHPTLGNQNGVFSALDRLETLGQQPGGVTPKDMETIRKNLVAAKTDVDGGTRNAARQAVNSFMDKYSGLGPADLLNGSNPFPELKDAIGNYAAGKRSNTVMGKVALADLNSATAGSGANQDNAMRQAVKQLVRPINNDIVPKAQRLGFNQAEIDALNQAARGTAVGNTARFVGKAAPTGIVSAAMSGGAGHVVGGPVGAVALPVVGYIAKKIGDLSTKRAVAAVDSLVRSRSPLAAHVAAQLPPQIINQLPAKSLRLLQAAVMADPVLRAQQQPSQAVGQ